MADLAKLLLRQSAHGPHASRAVHEVVAAGLGEPGGSPTIDPVSDAVAQLAVVNAYFAVLAAGGSPTASQYAAAQAALGALGADLRSMQLEPSPPPGSKMWVSGPAAVGVAGVSALVGGVLGWMARGSKGTK
jgi:hypothetical protein